MRNGCRTRTRVSGGRAVFSTENDLVKVLPKCEDLCGLKPERWKSTTNRGQIRVTCEKCGRFIGYAFSREETKRRYKKKAGK